MKPKKMKQKLSLHKTTIADLENAKMQAVKGGAIGATETGYTCVFCDTNISCDPAFKCLWEVTCPPGCVQQSIMENNAEKKTDSQIGT